LASHINPSVIRRRRCRGHILIKYRFIKDHQILHAGTS